MILVSNYSVRSSYTVVTLERGTLLINDDFPSFNNPSILYEMVMIFPGSPSKYEVGRQMGSWVNE